MPRYKSFLKNIKIEKAKRTHNCRFNKNRVIKKGDYRLCLTEGRSDKNYSLEEVLPMIEKDLKKLLEIKSNIEILLKSPPTYSTPNPNNQTRTQP